MAAKVNTRDLSNLDLKMIAVVYRITVPNFMLLPKSAQFNYYSAALYAHYLCKFYRFLQKKSYHLRGHGDFIHKNVLPKTLLMSVLKPPCES